MKQVLGAINRQAEVNYAQVLNRTLLIINGGLGYADLRVQMPEMRERI